MSAGLERLSHFWREQGDPFVERLCDDLVANAGPSYAAMPREQLLASVRHGVVVWQEALESGDPAPILERARGIGTQRSATQVMINQVMRTSDIFREHVWQLMEQLYADGSWDIAVVRVVERWLHEQRNAVFGMYGQTLQEAWDSLAQREEALQGQSRLIQELSTPIVPIYEGVLVLPLVGAVDSRRATEVMEAVLEQIVAYQADVVILDITGVPVVDTGVANHLLQTTRAVKLLGAQVILVGISAEIAHTIIQLGVNLTDIATMANLEAGIAYALAQHGLAVGPLDPGTSAHPKSSHSYRLMT